MTEYYSKSLMIKSLFFIIIGLSFFYNTGCKSDVSSKKQQKAFYVDPNGNLLNNQGEIVKKEGEFKLEDGYYVDNNGEKIKRNIDIAKEKINETVDNTKEAVSDAANQTAENVKDTFNKMFNTKAVGTAYPLSGITFDPSSHRITNMSMDAVKGLAAALKEHPESRIQVQVHTADGKTKIDCKELSKLRAEVVKDMMVTLGVNADQISAKGLGLTAEDAEKAVANTVEVVVEQ